MRLGSAPGSATNGVIQGSYFRSALVSLSLCPQDGVGQFDF